MNGRLSACVCLFVSPARVCLPVWRLRSCWQVILTTQSRLDAGSTSPTLTQHPSGAVWACASAAFRFLVLVTVYLADSVADGLAGWSSHLHLVILMVYTWLGLLLPEQGESTHHSASRLSPLPCLPYIYLEKAEFSVFGLQPSEHLLLVEESVVVCSAVWCLVYVYAKTNTRKWNESGFRPPLCTYRLNWARRTSWGWWDDWGDTVLQTQDSKFEPWRSETDHATSRSRRLPTILTFTRGWGRNIFSPPFNFN